MSEWRMDVPNVLKNRRNLYTWIALVRVGETSMSVWVPFRSVVFWELSPLCFTAMVQRTGAKSSIRRAEPDE